MLNRITIMGRLTRDPELRKTSSGVSVASFRIACDRDRAPTGQEKETDFVDVVAWKNTADFVSRNFHKGSMAIVSGRLQMRNWTDKEGQKRIAAEVNLENIYFGEKRQSDREYGNPPGSDPEDHPAPECESQDVPNYEELNEDDELPF